MTLANYICPGDNAVMTCAIENLSRAYPGKFRLAVKTHHPDIYRNNPHLTENGELRAPSGWLLEMHYNTLLQQCNQQPFHFTEGYNQHLAESLGVPIPMEVRQPCIYLSDEEKNTRPGIIGNGAYALISCGTKRDYTAKFAGRNIFQEVVDRFQGEITFVQVGASGDDHPRLSGVLNLIGQTSIRDLICLAYHSQFGVGGVTALHHIYAAFNKRYICLAGGREPHTWEAYPSSVFLHTIGALDCCKTGGCWRNKTVAIDGDTSLCAQPVNYKGDMIPRCLEMIGSEGVIRAIEDYTPKRRLPVLNIPDLQERIIPKDPRLGVVITTYGNPALVELQLAARHKWYRDVPIMVFDDASPAWREINKICARYDVECVVGTFRHGHRGGDMAGFLAGLVWAERLGIDLLAKFSRRWLPMCDWRGELLELASRTQYATYSNVCNRWGFGFRTECLGMHVASWMANTDEMRRLIAQNAIGLPEHDIHVMSQRIHPTCRINQLADREDSHRGGGFAVWDWMGTAKPQKRENVLWHESHSPMDYLEAAHSLGIKRYSSKDFDGQW